MRKLLLLLSLSLLFLSLKAQEDISESLQLNGEAHILLSKQEFFNTNFDAALYIDEHFHHQDSVRAIVTSRQIELFEDLNLAYTLLPHPMKNRTIEVIDGKDLGQSKSTDCATFLSAYPSYGLYEQMMDDFANDYPEICRYEEIGVLPSGRKLMALVISDNVNTVEDEPRFLYTSTMHGDETAGYILSLRLIKDLLCNYGSDDHITYLVDNIEIWINPLANPDGTYAWGNNNLNGARRTNANFVDLNRNYLDPQDGPNPDGNSYQPETVAFMELAENVHFNMSSNMHGGVEVANYPWDTWSFNHADDDWWIHVCREYADSAQADSPFGYFDAFNDGITNGFDWYEVDGGRQDFMTYFHRGREMTLELSNQKFIPSSQFDNFWNYNRRSLYNYLEQCLFGLRGIITDAETGNPIQANVFIANHDMENSDVFSQVPIGNYHRYLFEGDYDVTFSADGYESQVINVTIENNQTTILDVSLQPLSSSCTVEGGSLEIVSGTTDICAGGNDPSNVEVSVTGNSGYGSVFGLVDEANDIILSSFTGSFNLGSLPAGDYQIRHMSYVEGLNINVANASLLEGCFDLSNPINILVSEVDGGTILTNDDTSICGDDGIASTLNIGLSGAVGENAIWVVLSNDLSQVIATSQIPDFNFDSFAAGNYKLLHVSYANGVNLSEVDPQNPVGCLSASNPISVSVANCNSLITDLNQVGDQVNMLFSPLNDGVYEIDLLDLNGKRLAVIYRGSAISGQTMLLSKEIANLATGVYVIQLIGEQVTQSQKVFID